jgi:iron complex transport system substrate-binding protein
MKVFIAFCMMLWCGTAIASTIVVEDRRGAQTFDRTPERIVVLDWALAQQVLDLGIVPVAAPEIGLYRDWVEEPAMPDGVVDIGRRDAPNLELLSTLNPDVIVASDLSEADVARLEQIAPTLVFAAFDGDHDNVAMARRIYFTLARLFDRDAFAQAQLDKMETEIDRLSLDLRQARYGEIADVAIIRMNDLSTVWIYGENSFAEAALHRLGLRNALPQSANRWGVVQRPLESLAEVGSGAVLAIRPHMRGTQVFETVMWRFMPFVQKQRFAEVPPVWSYGGILALGRHARAIHAGLTSLAP